MKGDHNINKQIEWSTSYDNDESPHDRIIGIHENYNTVLKCYDWCCYNFDSVETIPHVSAYDYVIYITVYFEDEALEFSSVGYHPN